MDRPTFGARLIAISDRRLMGNDPVAAAARLLDAGLPAFQWREKDLTPLETYRSLLDLRERILQGTRCTSGSSGSPACATERAQTGHAAPIVLVNDRVDVARALGLGVHLTESSLPTRVAREQLPSEQPVGRSTHAFEAARRAEEEGADYVIFGPIYDTPSKRPFGPPLGTQRLAEVAGALSIPVLAIGGIDAARVRECVDAGAAGVCVIRALWEDPDPLATLRQLLGEIEAAL